MGEGVLWVHKPSGRTSFSLIPALRRFSGQSKVGHAGTLDSFAEGLMIYLLGKTYTKKAQDFISLDKKYEGIICLGIATDTLDPLGIKIQESEFQPTLEALQRAVTTIVGKQEQIPPLYSAKKILGKRLSDYARAGVEVVPRIANIEVYSFTILEYCYPHIHFTCHVSSGTYIRVLAKQIAEAVGSCGHLNMLKRISIGPWSIERAVPFDQISSDSLATYLTQKI